ncbi:transmembrane protein [Cystoisospora suis]|uniref:Transmembrane protein n=1 Tax=Cystoisospora suis TaxID=483139 RepID=A0A2C6KTZ0_9APIC|nr:transmembrane protein [Cystoisospora suis]
MSTPEAYSSSFLSPCPAKCLPAKEREAHHRSMCNGETSPRSFSCYTRKKKMSLFSSLFSGSSPVFSFFSSITSPEQEKEMMEKIVEEVDANGVVHSSGVRDEHREEGLPVAPEKRKGFFVSFLGSPSSGKEDSLSSSCDRRSCPSFLFPAREAHHDPHTLSSFSEPSEFPRSVGLPTFLMMMLKIRGSETPRLMDYPVSGSNTTDAVGPRHKPSTIDKSPPVLALSVYEERQDRSPEMGACDGQTTGNVVQVEKKEDESDSVAKITGPLRNVAGDRGGSALRRRRKTRIRNDLSPSLSSLHHEENGRERSKRRRESAQTKAVSYGETDTSLEISSDAVDHTCLFPRRPSGLCCSSVKETDGYPGMRPEDSEEIDEGRKRYKKDSTLLAKDLHIAGHSRGGIPEVTGDLDEADGCPSSVTPSPPPSRFLSFWSFYASRFILFLKSLLPEIFVHWLQSLHVDREVKGHSSYAAFEQGGRGIEQEIVQEKKKSVFITEEAGRLLWKSACSLVLNPLVAFYCQCYILSGLGTLVFATSICHWWKPELGLRRTIDVVTVCIVASIHWITALCCLESSFQLLYLLVTGTGTLCYFRGCAYASRGEHMLGAWCHVALHAMGTIGNTILYLYFAFFSEERMY